jgi:glycopeptide antibiotics resistance protein
MEEIIGALMLGALGAYVRMVFINATSPQGSKKISFNEIYRGPKGMEKMDRFFYQLKNNLTGFMLVGIVLALIFKVFS